MAKVNRRTFVKTSAAAVAGVCLGCTGGCENHESDTPMAPPQSISVQDGVVTIDLGQTPELQQIGGSVKLRRPDLPKIIVIRSDQETYHAYEDKCTHAGSPLTYQHENGLLHCGHHGSTFDLEGNAQKAPARTPLPKYDVTMEDQLLRINIG